MTEQELMQQLKSNEQTIPVDFTEYLGVPVMSGLGTPIAPEVLRKSDSTRRKNAKHRLIYNRQNGLCAYCDLPFAEARLTFDHIKPKSKGGAQEHSNIVLACHRCNSLKGNVISLDDALERASVFISFVNTLHAKGYLK